MGAVLKLYDDQPEHPKNMVFAIPLQSQVAKYMKERKGWPDTFCDAYAEKFWNFYQSKGWVVGRVKMKDWKAAFNAQWQEVSDPVMVKMLNEMIAQEKQEKVKTLTVEERLNQILDEYKKCEYKPSPETWQRLYQYLKEKGWMRLPKDQIEEIRELAGNSNERGREICVRTLFTNMINDGRRFG